MFLSHIYLQNFRNYKKSEFTFSKDTTLIVGPNASGKTNLLEAVYLLASGKSFRAEKDTQLIRFNEDIARVKGSAEQNSEQASETTQLEVMLTTGLVNGQKTQMKKYMVNGVPKRRIDFISHLPAVLFAPVDLDMIVSSPHLRREFLNDVLELVDKEYRFSLNEYVKALRQRNALLETAKDTGRRQEREFEYWDNVLIKNGNIVTKKREELIQAINDSKKNIFDFIMFYDKSVISRERLDQYEEGELGSGVTLVGPHRDDFSVHMYNMSRSTTHDVKLFGSRGQQRLVVLQLKVLQLLFTKKRLNHRPALLLDDIFSELDEGHIHLVLEMLGKQ